MSAKANHSEPDATDDDAPPDRDAYPIAIPDEFLDAFEGAADSDSDSVRGRRTARAEVWG